MNQSGQLSQGFQGAHTAPESQCLFVNGYTYEVYYDQGSRVCIRRWFGNTPAPLHGMSVEDVRDADAPSEVMKIVMRFVTA